MAEDDEGVTQTNKRIVDGKKKSEIIANENWRVQNYGQKPATGRCYCKRDSVT